MMKEKPNIIVSACLLGVRCRYDGRSVENSTVLTLDKKANLIPVCAEIMGGLPTPRLPGEIIDGRVIRKDGADITAEYMRGAEEVLRLSKIFGCKYAVLKERSPSCGKGKIYDGTFSGKLICGDGVTAALLMANGIKVYGESELDALTTELDGSGI